MKKIKNEILVKAFVAMVILAGFGLAGKMIYESFSRVMKINPAMVDSYRPYLNVGLVKKAAQSLGEEPASVDN